MITQAMHSAWKIIFFFTLFGIFISCLGLLGLSIFSTQQRTKEISIRRVNGANLPGILFLVNKEFLKLAVISFVIGVPASILIMNIMVKQFFEQTRLSPWVFILVGLALLIISIGTVSYQALRTAKGNLAENLRYE
jgi:putative ABC transport system permease protein